MTHADPRTLLAEAHRILDGADAVGRDLTPQECFRLDALLDAADALGRLERYECRLGPTPGFYGAA